MKNLLRNETLQFIEGQAGKLELAISHPAALSPTHVAMVCHPHPLYGGTFHNKVVTTLVKTYQALHCITIRFNFRGVGDSAGEYSHGQGECDDLHSVIAYAKNTLPTRDIYLAGFSFGAYVATQVACQMTPAHLLTIAPPVRNFMMQDLHPTCPWLLVQGDQDEIVAASDVYAFAASRKHPPEIIRFPTATHFFHGQLNELQDAVYLALLAHS